MLDVLAFHLLNPGLVSGALDQRLHDPLSPRQLILTPNANLFLLDVC